METLEIRKAELRRQIKEKKKALSSLEKVSLDRKLCERVVSHPWFREVGCVYGYASLPSEAGTWDILKAALDQGKRLALPLVSGKTMDFYYVRSLEELTAGAYGIMEPSPGAPLAQEADALVLVPGTAFTKDGKRLGKGGGYYDRFFEKEPEHPTLGLAYDFQIVQELDESPWDRRVREVATPDALLITP